MDVGVLGTSKTRRWCYDKIQRDWQVKVTLQGDDKKKQGGGKKTWPTAGGEKLRRRCVSVYVLMQRAVGESLVLHRQGGRNREKDGGGWESAEEQQQCEYEMKKRNSDKDRGRRNRLKRGDNDEETIGNKGKETELQLARCVYRSQMSGGNCAEGLFCRHLAAESSGFFHKGTHTHKSIWRAPHNPTGCFA